MAEDLADNSNVEVGAFGFFPSFYPDNDRSTGRTYYWHDWVGATVQLFDTWGSRDPLLYADNRAFSPNSTGVRFQIDATPWGNDVSPFGPRFNMRVGLQYTIYTKFDGAGRNYDGTGRDAADNNTLRIFAWFAL